MLNFSMQLNSKLKYVIFFTLKVLFVAIWFDHNFLVNDAKQETLKSQGRNVKFQGKKKGKMFPGFLKGKGSCLKVNKIELWEKKA